MKWAVAKLRTGAEQFMHEVCKEIGVESECPMITRKRRRPGSPTRERFEEPALSGYLCMTAASVEAPETRERLREEASFYDFLRDVTNALMTMPDSALDPLRMITDGEPVEYTSGPVFRVGEVIAVPQSDDPKFKCFSSMKGQVIFANAGRVVLDNYDFTKPTEFPALKLLRMSV